VPVVQHALGKSSLPPADQEAKRPNGRSTKPSGQRPQGQKKQWNPMGRDGGAGGGNRNHGGGAGAPKRAGGNAGGGKPSWMKEISGAKSDRRPVRVGE
jgi:hypothetical protein